ncbi:MAG: OmpA family protein, partial [Cardiobacteriaceae bacterium]|nr:OmpA family protein [Cardiobacteriaceae bacterium]
PILIPDILDKTPEQIAFETRAPLAFQPGSGLRVDIARCDNGTLITPNLLQTRDEHGVRQLKPGSLLNIGKDGAGEMLTANARLKVNADGSGELLRSYDQYAIKIKVEADGSGTYIGPEGKITIDGQGGGEWISGTHIIRIQPDGAGEWINGGNIIRIKADGSGEWIGTQRQKNHGDGTGSHGIPATTVAMPPWPPAPKVGSFDLFRPFTVPGDICGYLITLDDSILFDFDKYHLRPDALQTLEILGKALADIRAEHLEIRGHTDSKGTDEYNQTLSEKRAQSVLADLKQRTGIENIHARGYGESQPVAPNDIDGKDSPANRQLNRRVEIFVKTQ